jgi:hypothetical protein
VGWELDRWSWWLDSCGIRRLSMAALLGYLDNNNKNSERPAFNGRGRKRRGSGGGGRMARVDVGGDPRNKGEGQTGSPVYVRRYAWIRC